ASTVRCRHLSRNWSQQSEDELWKTVRAPRLNRNAMLQTVRARLHSFQEYKPRHSSYEIVHLACRRSSYVAGDASSTQNLKARLRREFQWFPCWTIWDIDCAHCLSFPLILR